MLLQVNFNEPLFRALFPILYSRVLSKTIVEGGLEGPVKFYFSRLLINDPNYLMLIDFDIDTNKVLAHCVVLFNTLPDGTINVYCEQMYADTGHSEAFTKDCIAFVSSLPNTSQITMDTSVKKYKAFAKKYGFTPNKVSMTYSIARDSNSNN